MRSGGREDGETDMVKRKGVAREISFKGEYTGFKLTWDTYGPSMEANVSKSASGPTSTSL